MVGWYQHSEKPSEEDYYLNTEVAGSSETLVLMYQTRRILTLQDRLLILVP
jgi:hypothetical protein